MTTDGRPHRQDTAARSTFKAPLRHRGRTTTTCTSRRRPTAAATGPRWTARSTAQPSPATPATTRHRPAHTRRHGSTSTFAAGRLRGQDDQFRVCTTPTDGGVGRRRRLLRRRHQRHGDGATVLTDGAETATTGGPLDGFTIVGATETGDFDELLHRRGTARTCRYDKYLKTGPYNFGFADTKPDWVEHFPYQPGLLISYWDTSQADNNTSEHPGSGPQPAHRRPPEAALQHRRRAVARPDPGVRRTVRPAEGRLVHAARQRQGQLHPRPGRAAGVQRHQEVLLRPSAEQGVKLPAVGVKIEVTRRERHLVEGQDQLTQQGRHFGARRVSTLRAPSHGTQGHCVFDRRRLELGFLRMIDLYVRATQGALAGAQIVRWLGMTTRFRTPSYS